MMELTCKRLLCEWHKKALAPLVGVLAVVGLISCQDQNKKESITVISLLSEMSDLDRLPVFTGDQYKTVQFSSYDRRSKMPDDSLWFSNEDGFGGEPVPGFEKVLKNPGSDSIGEYLICDIHQPGVIQRLWTAGINGTIRLFLDNSKTPLYEGNAEDFFWKTAWALSGRSDRFSELASFRQSDACYFPIPFSKACRIEWSGDISKIHFYHVGIRIYRKDTDVKTFSKAELLNNYDRITEVNRIMGSASADIIKKGQTSSTRLEIKPQSKSELFTISGSKAIRYLAVKINDQDPESALRNNILSIYFDGSPTPQVQAPVGDFFGAAPGVNPYSSLAFRVKPEGEMSCCFVMPFKRSARAIIENISDSLINIDCKVVVDDYQWIEGKTMYFRARWHTDNGITASFFGYKANDIQDLTYLMAVGSGRVVGAAAYIYNPSNAVTSWGNWWGEGDEKIFIDHDTFPSFFGTGTEDYFNYSWSSSEIFSFPYCGQVRNDGPGNRGYVSDYRLHIFDDIPFSDNIVFNMELANHGIVKDFSYGRIVYFYGLPGILDNYSVIPVEGIKKVFYKKWSPVAYLGSEGFRFIEAQDAVISDPSARVENDNLCSGNNILVWSPSSKKTELRFLINSERADNKARIGFTLEHNPIAGEISFTLNGKHIKVDRKDTLNLFQPLNTFLNNHFSDEVSFNKGRNEISVSYAGKEKDKRIGIDFIWIKENK